MTNKQRLARLFISYAAARAAASEAKAKADALADEIKQELISAGADSLETGGKIEITAGGHTARYTMALGATYFDVDALKAKSPDIYDKYQARRPDGLKFYWR